MPACHIARCTFAPHSLYREWKAMVSDRSTACKLLCCHLPRRSVVAAHLCERNAFASHSRISPARPKCKRTWLQACKLGGAPQAMTAYFADSAKTGCRRTLAALSHTLPIPSRTASQHEASLKNASEASSIFLGESREGIE